MIMKLGFQNLFRHRRRTILTMSAIALAVGLITYAQCHFHGIVNGMLDDYVRFQSGHVKIVHPDYMIKERLLPLNKNIPQAAARLKELQALPDAQDVAPRLRFGGLLIFNDTNEGGVGVGIDPALEEKFSKYAKDIKDGGKLLPGGIVIGVTLAKKLGIKAGDEVTILSQTQYHSIAAGNFKVTGILATGLSFIDKTTYYINLPEAQNLLDMEDRVSELVVKGNDREKTAALLGEMMPLAQEHKLALLSWQDQGGIGQMLNSARVGMSISFSIVLLLAALTIANTMLMSVLERTKEIGTLLAMGMRPKKVVLLFLCEGFYIGLFGSLAGISLGSGIALLLERTGINLGNALQNISMPVPQIVYPRFFWGAPLLALGFGITAAIVASVLPAYKAAKLLPREAMS